MASQSYRPQQMSAAQLRGLAHPLRLELLQLLRAEGPATATQLARRLGESSGSTSYHLRALHRAGMVEEAERRNGRERWWQGKPGHLMIPNSIPPDATGRERTELQAVHAQIESIFVERDEQALASWMAIRYDLPLDWQDAQYIGNFRLWGTAAEIEQFVSAVLDLAQALRRPPETPDSDHREVLFTLRLLPQEPLA